MIKWKKIFSIKFFFFLLDEYEFGGYNRGINEFLEPNSITFLSDNTITFVIDTNSSQVKLFDPDWQECILMFG